MGRKNLTQQVATLQAEVNFWKGKAHELEKQNTRFAEGQRQISRLVDGILVAVAVEFGEKRETDGQTDGYRIALPMDLVLGGLTEYEIRAERDSENNEYVIGAVKKIKKGDA